MLRQASKALEWIFDSSKLLLMKRVNRKSIVATVADEIRQAILSGKLVPGDRIQQDELASQLGVSRLPVRQAILVLEAEGLVHTEHRRGSIVAPIDLEFIDQIYEFRREVDARVAAILASRRDFDPTPLRAIVKEALEEIQTGDRRRFHERQLSSRFYKALYLATGSRVLGAAMDPLLSHIYRVLSSLSPADRVSDDDSSEFKQLRHFWENHAALIEAIAAGQIGRAKALARTHSTEVVQSIQRRLAAIRRAAMLKAAGSPKSVSDRVSEGGSAHLDSGRAKARLTVGEPAPAQLGLTEPRQLTGHAGSPSEPGTETELGRRHKSAG
jgi:DNA-binding GntR family transcriptional regulator